MAWGGRNHAAYVVLLLFQLVVSLLVLGPSLSHQLSVFKLRSHFVIQWVFVSCTGLSLEDWVIQPVRISVPSLGLSRVAIMHRLRHSGLILALDPSQSLTFLHLFGPA